jgi:hypothetical protein
MVNMRAKRKEATARAEYAMLRMTLAQRRMLLAIGYDDEWETAYRWATAWGRAIKMAPRCPHVATCRYYSDACPIRAWGSHAGRQESMEGLPAVDAH